MRIIGNIKRFWTPIALDEQAKQYFLEQYLKHAVMTVKYALAASAMMLYFEWRNAQSLAYLIWGVGVLVVQLVRYMVARQTLSSPDTLSPYLFYSIEVLAAVWWVAFLFLPGWNEQNEFLTLWRGSIVFIIVVFYLDTMRYSQFALLLYPLTICIGNTVNLYTFNLSSEEVKFGISVMLVFGTATVFLFGRSSYLLSYETYKVIAQNRRLVIAMDKMLIHDELTKQHNRRYFDSQLLQHLALFKRTQQPFCLAILDIDYFKRVNDKYGHSAGDHVLVELSTYIKEGLRVTDVFARYGGEEFVILLPMTEQAASVEMLDRLRAGLASQVFSIKGVDIQLTISIGVTMVCKEDVAAKILVRADEALYQAKGNGRNQVVLI